MKRTKMHELQKQKTKSIYWASSKLNNFALQKTLVKKAEKTCMIKHNGVPVCLGHANVVLTHFYSYIFIDSCIW